MKIVVDTNVVISGVFFGGNPRRIIEAVADGSVDAYATTEILDEYMGIIDYMMKNMKWTAKQAMEALGISEADQSKYSALL